jgi:hypothetical protein
LWLRAGCDRQGTKDGCAARVSAKFCHCMNARRLDVLVRLRLLFRLWGSYVSWG